MEFVSSGPSLNFFVLNSTKISSIILERDVVRVFANGAMGRWIDPSWCIYRHNTNPVMNGASTDRIQTL